MKTIKVKWLFDGFPVEMSSFPYMSENGTHFVLIHKNNLNKFIQIGRSTLCRETLTSNFRHAITSEDIKSKLFDGKARLQKENIDKLSNTNLKIAIIYLYKGGYNKETQIAKIKKIEEYMKRGVRLINVLEKHQGWPLTKFYECLSTNKKGNKDVIIKNISKKSKTMNAYLLDSPQVWTRTPQLLSLLLLTFRIGRFEGFNNVKELNDLKEVYSKKNEKAIQSMIEKSNIDCVKRDFESYKVIHQFLELILNNYRKLFLNRPLKTCYRCELGITGGVMSFIFSDCRSKSLINRWEKLIQECNLVEKLFDIKQEYNEE